MSDLSFHTIKEMIEPDSRGRFSIGAIAKGNAYRVQMNGAGQILLDPVVAVPEQELWLGQTPGAMASVQRGIAQATSGELQDLGSFDHYAELELGEE